MAMKAVIAALCFLGLLAPLCAEELTLHWKEVPQSLVDNRKVEVHLKAGTALRGKALAVTPEGLRMEITKVREGGGNYQKGESLILAGEITMMRVNRTGTHGRIIGTAIGGTVSALIIGLVFGLGLSHIEGTAEPGIAVAALIPTGVGYLLGWARDRRTTTIHVQP
jgi:hypothetical protein